MKQTKTIPFDWEKYKNNRDKNKVVTRDGYEITQLTKFENVKNESLVGVLENRTNKWHLNGLHYREVNSGYDLQLQHDQEGEGSWVYLYRTDDGSILASRTYSTKEQAEFQFKDNPFYIKTINLKDLVKPKRLGMKEINKEEYNKLCAEFLGGTLYKMEAPLNPQWFGLPFEKRGIPEGLLKFDSDWNWIMGVLENIENIYGVSIIGSPTMPHVCSIFLGNNEYKIGRGNSKKEAVIRAIWEFLNWYNQQEK